MNVLILTRRSDLCVGIPISAVEIEKRTRETLMHLDRMARDEMAVKESMPIELITSKGEMIFEYNARVLRNLELRIWSEFIDPKLLVLVMELEEDNELLSGDIEIPITLRVTCLSATRCGQFDL